MVEILEKEVAILDVETTGLYPEKDLILEIGICGINLETGEIRKIFDNIMKESDFSDIYRDSWIFLNSSLTYDDVFNASLLEDYREELQLIFDNYPVSAYNQQFDFGFLEHRGFTFSKKLPDPMIRATNILKIRHWNSCMGYKWPRVEESWRYFFPNIQYVEKHRAYDDAVHEALIFHEMVKNNHINV